MQAKRALRLIRGGLWGEEARGTDEVAVVRVADFQYDALTADEAPTRRTMPRHLVGPRLLGPGDLLLEKSGGGDQQNVGRVVEWTGTDRAICSNFINLLRPAPGFDPRWLAYVHRWLYVTGRTHACTKQTTGIQNLDVSAYLASSIPRITHGAQRSIAEFLDGECERIERLTNRTSSFSRLRSEGYSALLQQAVGLGRWPWVQVRHVARTGTGHTPSREHPEYWVPDDLTVPWFTLADVWQIREDEREVVTDTVERVSPLGLAKSSAVKHPAGTVLLSRTASVGYSAVMGADMAVSQDFMTWSCGDRLDPFFLLYALRALRPDLHRLMMGSTHQTIYMPDLHALRIPLPPVTDQQNTVAAIRRQLAPHWSLRARIEALHSRLAEYCDALITDAVTGQIDVARVSGSQMEERVGAAAEGRLAEVTS